MYFITICTQENECLFGYFFDGRVVLNEKGKLAEREWKKLPLRFNDIEVNRYVIMPNHMHGIINMVGAGLSRPETWGLFNDGRENPTPTRAEYDVTLGRIIGYYKYQSTKQINLIRNVAASRIWQRNYYEHIIRDDKDLERIQTYIYNNPITWHLDKYYKKY